MTPVGFVMMLLWKPVIVPATLFAPFVMLPVKVQSLRRVTGVPLLFNKPMLLPTALTWSSVTSAVPALTMPPLEWLPEKLELLTFARISPGRKRPLFAERRN